jgi:hypothetical protein
MIMLLGTPNRYMISQMNSTVLTTIMEVAGFTLIHFVNLSTATKMCVNPPLASLEWTYQIQSPCRKKSGDRYGLELMRWHMFWVREELAPFTVIDQGVSVRDGSGPVEPHPICFAHKHACTFVTPANS